MRESQLEVSQSQSGWHQRAPLGEATLYIGGQLAEGIALPESLALGEQGRLMVRPVGQGQFGYLLYNLSDVTITFHPYLKSAEIPSRALHYGEWVLLHDRDQVEFGNYRLIYFVGNHELTELTFQVELEESRLSPNRPLSGTVRVFSQSNQAIQPIVEILGVPNDIRPGALVSNPANGIPIRFQLFHPQASTPPAGIHPVVFQVTEPKVFPGKFGVRTHMIQIEPYPHHQVRLQPNALANLRPNRLQGLGARIRTAVTNVFHVFRPPNRRSG